MIENTFVEEVVKKEDFDRLVKANTEAQKWNTDNIMRLMRRCGDIQAENRILSKQIERLQLALIATLCLMLLIVVLAV